MINENIKYFQKFVKKCQKTVFLPKNKGHISNKSQTYFHVDVLAHRMPRHTLLKLEVYGNKEI